MLISSPKDMSSDRKSVGDAESAVDLLSQTLIYRPIGHIPATRAVLHLLSLPQAENELISRP